MNNKFFNASTAKDTLTMTMYNTIGESWDGEGATPAMVVDALKGSFTNIELHLNSPGGAAFDGVAIYNILKACSKPVNVIIDGMAASAASIVAMAGDTITMKTGSVMMIHNGMAMAMGDAKDMRKMADTLDTVTSSISDIYVAKTGMPKDEVLAMMDAETWMTADEAVVKCFATSVSKDKSSVKNEFDLKMFRNAPKEDAPAVCACGCTACKGGDCPKCSNGDCTDEVCNCSNCKNKEEKVVNDAPDLSIFTHQLEINRRK